MSKTLTKQTLSQIISKNNLNFSPILRLLLVVVGERALTLLRIPTHTKTAVLATITVTQPTAATSVNVQAMSVGKLSKNGELMAVGAATLIITSTPTAMSLPQKPTSTSTVTQKPTQSPLLPQPAKVLTAMSCG